MEDQTAILANAMQQDPFEIVMRGYNRRQVDEYVARSRDQIRDLESRLAHALDAVEQSRRELTDLRTQSANRPAHEEVSERLSQILRLAAEEAEQERTKAESEIGQLRETADQEIGTLVQEARDEADEILSAAREQAENTMNHSRQESQQLLASSREEAEQVVTEATEHAERVRRQAEHRASVVNGVLSDRLAALTDAHGLAVRRLAEIQGTLADLLHGEEQAGPLSAAVSFTDAQDAQDAEAPIGTADAGLSADEAEVTPATGLPATEMVTAPETVIDAVPAMASTLDAEADTEAEPVAVAMLGEDVDEEDVAAVGSDPMATPRVIDLTAVEEAQASR